ncbi:MAG TPA: hypothetical protein VFP10_07380, partial [Candidatus Eisenbacteria bacterium]|nr:hypothetical protein [Candidatus Eisenbacteria bacterium]
MPDRLLSSLAALGIAFAPAFLKFAGSTGDEELEVDEAIEAACVKTPSAPIHARHKGVNDIEARLTEGAVVQVLSSRQN